MGRPELVFGLVGPVGTRVSDLKNCLVADLKGFNYSTVDIHVSDLLRHFKEWVDEPDPSTFMHIEHRQRLGFAFRSRLGDGAALARATVAKIRDERTKISGNADRPAVDHAFIVDQLKHPAEVALLREVYGEAFLLIAGHAPDDKREKRLAQMQANDEQATDSSSYIGKARSIIVTDMKQDDEEGFGQNTRDTYPLADFFANLGVVSGENRVGRFVDLLFGHPFHTPYSEEYAMYQASSVALRSSDENRQVGAAIVKFARGNLDKRTNTDVVALGMNEVPRRGGGFYWFEDSPDGRDQWLLAYRDGDRAKTIKISMLKELLERIKKKDWLGVNSQKVSPHELARLLLPELKGTQFLNIGEFMRPVHAEMAAIIDAARRGVAIDGLTMYVTTFPCHNCAKHIIASGIRQVIYLEPYPKSRTDFLHPEEVELLASEYVEQEKVVFLAYTGIAPRQYRRLFSMAARGGKNGVSLKDWPAKKMTLWPRYVSPFAFHSIIAAEKAALKTLNVEIYNWDSAKCG